MLRYADTFVVAQMCDATGGAICIEAGLKNNLFNRCGIYHILPGL